jgi:hypothetical protein
MVSSYRSVSSAGGVAGRVGDVVVVGPVELGMSGSVGGTADGDPSAS